MLFVVSATIPSTDCSKHAHTLPEYVSGAGAVEISAHRSCLFLRDLPAPLPLALPLIQFSDPLRSAQGHVYGWPHHSPQKTSWSQRPRKNIREM